MRTINGGNLSAVDWNAATGPVGKANGFSRSTQGRGSAPWMASSSVATQTRAKLKASSRADHPLVLELRACDIMPTRSSLPRVERVP